jgi:glycosyltransferase involved in cell wall biosynthesis
VKLLILSDSPTITTGYGNIAYYFTKYLLRHGGYEVFFGSLQQIGGPTYVKVDGNYVPMYSATGGTKDALERTVSECRPDVLIHIRDPVALNQKFFPAAYSIRPVASQYGVKVVHWAPLMGPPTPDTAAILANDADLVLAPTKFAYNHFLFAGVPANKLETLMWGVDPEDYYPDKPDRKMLGFSDNSFVILSVGVHDRHHKNYPLILKALTILLKKYDVELYLHTSSGAFALDDYVKMLGLKGRVLLPAKYSKDWGYPVNIMRTIYSSCNCYCTASSAEGFNMPAVEAVFTGLPVVASAHPVHMEVLGDMALYAKTYEIHPDSFHFNHIVDPEDLAAKLSQVIEGEFKPDKSQRDGFVAKMSWARRVEEFHELMKARGWT